MAQALSENRASKLQPGARYKASLAMTGRVMQEVLTTVTDTGSSPCHARHGALA